MIDLNELSRLAQSAYKPRPLPAAWKRIADFDRNGFRATLFQSRVSPLGVLAVRGTFGLGDCLQDVRLLCGREPRVWRAGNPVMQKARETLGHRRELLLTGHSIGGAYASALGARHRVSTITFNAPGMLEALRRSHTSGNTSWIQPGLPWILNVCVREDWVWRLSGPGLGRDLVLERHAPAPDEVFAGPLGVIRALRWGRRTRGGLARFVESSLHAHGMRAIREHLSAG